MITNIGGAAHKGDDMNHVMSRALVPVLTILMAGLLQSCTSPDGDGGNGSEPSDAAGAPGELPAAAQSPSTQSIQQPAIRVNPGAGPPGATIAVAGQGFEMACGVDLLLDAVDALGSAVVGDAGTFSVQLVVPESAEEGDHSVVAEGRESDGESCTQPIDETAETDFIITAPMPLITLAVLEGRPGTAVEVEGRGFCADTACSPVTLLIDGQTSATDVAVEDDGTFVAEAFVPAIDAAGEVAVVAIQSDVQGMELRAFGELIVTVKPDEPPVVIQ